VKEAISHHFGPRGIKSGGATKYEAEQQSLTPSTKMDLGELEQDEKLYRASPELLLDFKTSLGPLLWTTSRSGRIQIRQQVRVKDTDRLVGLVELQLSQNEGV
jgi:hypothetical protein